ncbi:FAD-dependent oxidoreductase [Larkinella harenae]
MTTEVLVVDSSPSGIIAAIAAARAGRQVVLITEDKHLGGMRTSGLAMSNAGNEKTFGGLGREFHTRVYRYYQTRYGLESVQAKTSRGGLRFEPHVAEIVFNDWLAETPVRVLTEERIVEVQKEKTRLRSVLTDKNRRITASVFIDASYEGDLMKLAGCSYRVGREGADEYGESLAGVRYPVDQQGEADQKTQRYTFRVCLTDSVENQIPITRPPNYHRASYAMDAAEFRANPPKSILTVLPLNTLPNRKTDSRTGEWIGGSWAFPEATGQERDVISREHEEYSRGYLWFLRTDESVPPAIRNELKKWGYAKDEFRDNNHWPYHIYVREARRLVGDFVMTQKDVLDEAARFKPDAVALGSYRLDVHDVQYIKAADEKAGVVKEGNIGAGIFTKPYEIPYRCLLPKRSEATNLLVTVCLSASHIAYSTLRMEPVYMMLGHAAGLAASMAIATKAGLHDVSIPELKSQLVKEQQRIDSRPFAEVAKNIDP